MISFYCLKTSREMNKIHYELNEKVSEIKRMQMELSRREDKDAELIKTLEKENVTLKVGNFYPLLISLQFSCFIVRNCNNAFLVSFSSNMILLSFVIRWRRMKLRLHWKQARNLLPVKCHLTLLRFRTKIQTVLVW